MAMQDSVHTVDAQMVGNAFVEQFYNMLVRCPEDVHKFYQDSSEMSRPASGGSMSSVSTMTGINEMILSLDYTDSDIQILTADAQKSFGGGVIVLVTGFLTGKDEIRRKFTQLFFLAPQDNHGFFVLNDVLRFVEEEEDTTVEVTDIADSAPVAAVTPDPEPTPVPDHPVPVQEPTVLTQETIQPNIDVTLPSENGSITASEKALVPNHVAETPQTVAPQATVVATQEAVHQPTEPAADAPKKSYASIANALNFKTQPFYQKPKPKPVVAPPAEAPAPAETPAQAPAQAQAQSQAPAPRPVRSNSFDRNTVKGHSIFVANLPMDATADQLTETFKKFGAIKPTGVQVRSYKLEKNCFGFVEFETAAALESALQVRSIMIGNREAHIERKNEEGGKSGPRFKGGRGGSYARGRGGRYQENSYNGPARGGGGRGGGEGNQRVYQNGGRGGGRQSQTRPAPAATPVAVEGGKN